MAVGSFQISTSLLIAFSVSFSLQLSITLFLFIINKHQHLSTEAQTYATSMRFCSSSVATSRSSSTSSLLSFNASTSSSALLAPTTSHISTLDNNLLFSMFFTCILKLCLFISLPPLSIHNRSCLSIYPRTFLSLSNENFTTFCSLLASICAYV